MNKRLIFNALLPCALALATPQVAAAAQSESHFGSPTEQPSRGEMTLVRIENRDWGDLEIFVRFRNGFVLLGTVRRLSWGMMAVPIGLLENRRTLVLLARPQGATAGGLVRRFPVVSGRTVGWSPLLPTAALPRNPRA